MAAESTPADYQRRWVAGSGESPLRVITQREAGVVALGSLVVDYEWRSKFTGSPDDWNTNSAKLPLEAIAFRQNLAFELAAQHMGPKGLLYENIVPIALADLSSKAEIVRALDDPSQPNRKVYKLKLGRLATAVLRSLARQKANRECIGRTIVSSDLLANVRYLPPLDCEDLADLIVRASREKIAPATIFTFRATNHNLGNLLVEQKSGSVRARRRSIRLNWRNVTIPLEEIQFVETIELQEFRAKCADEGCDDDELKAILFGVIQPTLALGGNNLNNLTKLVTEKAKSGPKDAGLGYVIQRYLRLTPVERHTQIKNGHWHYNGVSVKIGFEEPQDIEGWLDMIATTMGIKRKRALAAAGSVE